MPPKASAAAYPGAASLRPATLATPALPRTVNLWKGSYYTSGFGLLSCNLSATLWLLNMPEMPRLNPDSRQSIHFGINFVAVPAPSLVLDKALSFQRRLAQGGIDLPSCQRTEQALELRRAAPPIWVRLAIVGPQVCQLLIVAEQPDRPLDLFKREVVAICDAYKHTWEVPKQFVVRDVTVRSLYSGSGLGHAFSYVWETLLRQSPEDAKMLGKPILGGGLRFVMPPIENDQPEPTAIEVKIESFLADPARLYVETQFSWPRPTDNDEFANAPQLLRRVEDYINNTLVKFMIHGEGA